MKRELFGDNISRHCHSVSCAPMKLFRQERDWTCAVACLRSLMSGGDGKRISDGQEEEFDAAEAGAPETKGAPGIAGAPGMLRLRDADEDTWVADLQLRPGPHFSREIKELGILKGCDVIYGCDGLDGKRASFDDILDLMAEGYNVMIETMINYSHWIVLLGFYPLDHSGENQLDDAVVTFFDPYYNEIRLIRAGELTGVWCDGDHEENGVKGDFIAMRMR